MITKGTLNKVILIGNLGDEVKIRYFEGGNCIARFSLATSEGYIKDGQRMYNTEWHTIVAKNKLGELCEKTLKKGDKVYLEGRIKSRQWQGEDGTIRNVTEIHVSEISTLVLKRDNAAKTQQDNGDSLDSMLEDYDL